MDQFNRMLARWEPMVLSIFRIMVGLLLFQYGVAKLFKFPPVPMFEKVELMSQYGAAGSIELIFGGLLILGLFTRPVAFILCGEMAFAYFIGHFPRGFIPLLNGGNAAILFCFSCLYLACAGGGVWSVDAMREKRV
jgi:putative oxidoreductase